MIITVITGGTALRQLRRWRPMLLSISSRLSAEELQSLDEKARKAGLRPGVERLWLSGLGNGLVMVEQMDSVKKHGELVLVWQNIWQMSC